MARPQSPDYDKRRATIIAAAADLFAARGFDGTSVAMLADACRTSKSLVYHYFPSKDDVLYAVMAAHLDALVLASSGAPAGGDPRERLREMTRRFMRLYVGAGASHKVLLNELDKLPETRRAEVVAKQREIIASFGRVLAEIRPDLDHAAAGRALTMLFFGMINWTHTWLRSSGTLSSDEIAGLASQLMLGGLEGLQV